MSDTPSPSAADLVQALAEPFHASELELRTQPFTAVYVDARTFVRRLNQVFPLDWSFRLTDNRFVDDKSNVSREGVLTLHTDWGNREFTSVGTETPDTGRGEPKQEKGSDADAFKRCCFRAGIGAYIYELPKDLKGPSLTEAQVTQAARMAGYNGFILPEHYGKMVASRAVSDSSPAGSSPSPAAAPSSPPPKSQGRAQAAASGPAPATGANGGAQPSGVRPEPATEARQKEAWSRIVNRFLQDEPEEDEEADRQNHAKVQAGEYLHNWGGRKARTLTEGDVVKILEGFAVPAAEPVAPFSDIPEATAAR